MKAYEKALLFAMWAAISVATGVCLSLATNTIKHIASQYREPRQAGEWGYVQAIGTCHADGRCAVRVHREEVAWCMTKNPMMGMPARCE